MSDFRAAGASVVAITPQLTDKSLAMTEEHGLTIPLLHDLANGYAYLLGLRHTLPQELRDVYQDFGIDLPSSNGEPSWTLPLPARYIVDPGGTIRYARVHADYTQRPEPGETLAALKRL